MPTTHPVLWQVLQHDQTLVFADGKGTGEVELWVSNLQSFSHFRLLRAGVTGPPPSSAFWSTHGADKRLE